MIRMKLKTRRRALAVPELALHLAIANLLARVCPKHVMWWHTPNGEKRDKATAGRLKAMGTTPGVPDFLLYDTQTGYLHCIEAKTAEGSLSDAQRGWKSRFDASPTGRYAVARSVDDAIQILQEWWPKSVRVAFPGIPSILPVEDTPSEAPAVKQGKRVAAKSRGAGRVVARGA